MSDLTTEKCGIIGMIGKDIPVLEFSQAFAPLQNRGEDAAGVVALNKKGDFQVVKNAGPIIELFSEKSSKLPKKSNLWIGHNRYATSAGTTEDNIQPFIGKNGNYFLALGHNGNLITDSVANLGVWVNERAVPGTSDSALMTSLLLQERPKYASWQETFIHELPKFRGSFSLVMITEEKKLYVVRDPWGVRPLSIGRKNQNWIVASETTSFNAIGANYIREVLPGELICFDQSQSYRSIIYSTRNQPENRCILETHYFSNSKSFDGYARIAYQREELGRGVAERFRKKNIEVDCVVPVLNSGLHVAKGVATALDLPLSNAVKVNGKKRTFIQNTTKKRKAAVYEKHVVLPQEITGKTILLADDSLVRGTSLGILIEKIRFAGPKAIHVILGSPPVIDTCDLGVDLPRQKDLLAAKWREFPLEKIERLTADFLGVDSVTFSENMIVNHSLEKHAVDMCTHCFGGLHPVKEMPRPYFRSELTSQLKKQKVLFLASGSGTNVDNLLFSMERGEILAQPVKVITNNPEAGVIDKAKKHGVMTTILPSPKAKFNSPERKKYEILLAKSILENKKLRPDVIVLAGWMLILGDAFNDKIHKAGIDMINIHPALISGKGQSSLITSVGRIPEIRGDNGIKKTYQVPFSSMPVTGVTVHRVSPHQSVDTGEVLVKAEVMRYNNEEMADLEARIHATEYLIFPIGLQQVLLKRLFKTKKKTYKKNSLKEIKLSKESRNVKFAIAQ